MTNFDSFCFQLEVWDVVDHALQGNEGEGVAAQNDMDQPAGLPAMAAAAAGHKMGSHVIGMTVFMTLFSCWCLSCLLYFWMGRL